MRRATFGISAREASLAVTALGWPAGARLAYSGTPFGPPAAGFIIFQSITMARITVEDCLSNVENLFQLVLLASQRARRLANGAEPTIAWENDKPTVVALREIAAGNITADMLREPEPPAEAPIPDLEVQSSFRAPQFGLGD